MECQKIVNLFDITSDDKDLPRYVTKKWIEVYDIFTTKKLQTNFTKPFFIFIFCFMKHECIKMFNVDIM